ncbi:MAG: ISKra4 family transposase [Woronichinia naegeliana WA131]|uniref:ISKra4 family transposase n=5 Tax=Cyanophyceae TaxID=3028117 RepID=A0A977L314_9CYAN|nr:MAG: ISKra4 family transposase [Woronichinia naegeliana WA131]UXE64611.1 MAG: ISKra4 family transposase [Woronichinia naegeliana WA131]UXE64708.1 MAG: ISKra4 family transposase [Woronichinia naegeliana WA131]UXE64711.1 MAG: ISKra4 family transposase [Woronichinia naegeliana WA131]UXE64888.1 MAG: ISKra4 family transposase [Woronichinia naegeliana WA131]
MTAKLINVEGSKIKIELTLELSRSMLDTEINIQKGLNEVGCIASKEALKYLDTDGSPLKIGEEIWKSKGEQPKEYQTPYGEVIVNRHVYQRSVGGKTYCPLEREARIIITSTPLLAKQVSSKMSGMAGKEVKNDLLENHGRKVALSYIQRLSEAVGSVVQAKEEAWSYAPPKEDSQIATVGIGLDGTCMLMCEDGYREAMVGTVSLYDSEGERQHTIYLGAAPEYGKKSFLERLEREIERAKNRYPEATLVGIADGAESNWKFLEKQTEEQILDFYHASGYLGALAEALHPNTVSKQKEWLTENCRELKHEKGKAGELLNLMKEVKEEKSHSKNLTEKLQAAITYYENHQHQMDYAEYIEKKYPIGSGVTEAACKTLVKQRLCCSGMRWKEKGAGIILSLRALVLTKERWSQFWAKLDQYGFPVEP